MGANAAAKRKRLESQPESPRRTRAKTDIIEDLRMEAEQAKKFRETQKKLNDAQHKTLEHLLHAKIASLESSDHLLKAMKSINDLMATMITS